MIFNSPGNKSYEKYEQSSSFENFKIILRKKEAFSLISKNPLFCKIESKYFLRKYFLNQELYLKKGNKMKESLEEQLDIQNIDPSSQRIL